jgi:hypothetical protein
MKYLVFLLWIPALVVLYLSVHQEIQAETHRVSPERPHTTAHAGHPH